MDKLDRMDRLSTQDMILLGIEDVAFVKPTTKNGQTFYLICAADGNEIGRSANRDVAQAAIRQHGLEPLSLH